MDTTTIGQAVGQLKTYILDNIRHNTLLKYTGTPLLNEKQLFFLLLPKLNGEEWTEEIETSAMTVGIVHASLAEHDKIHETNATSKEQQLTVLSGDYYSGRYYQLLALTGNIELIRRLSEAIVDRCEHEIMVYERGNRDFQDWVDVLTVIETALIERFFYVYQFDDYLEVMREALTVARLNRELAALLAGKPSIYVSCMQVSLEKQAVEKALQQEISKRKQTLNATLEASTYSEALKQAIVDMVS
jgi:heptaprenyl diphosphate synthase